MKKNCWVSFDSVTQAKTGSGIGQRQAADTGEVILYRDTMEEVDALPASIHERTVALAHESKWDIPYTDRQYAKLLKYQDARDFLAAAIPAAEDRAASGAAGILLIDAARYPSLYREYVATHELIAPMTPDDLAHVIIQRAMEAVDLEVERRCKILNAEIAISATIPEIPNE